MKNQDGVVGARRDDVKSRTKATLLAEKETTIF